MGERTADDIIDIMEAGVPSTGMKNLNDFNEKVKIQLGSEFRL